MSVFILMHFSLLGKLQNDVTQMLHVGVDDGHR